MDRRKCPWIPVMLPAVFSGERAGGGMVLDLSLEGCRVRSAAPIDKGNYLRMRIDLIGQTLNPELAVVRWSKEEEFGVELIRMEPQEQDRLREFFTLLSPSPI